MLKNELINITYQKHKMQLYAFILKLCHIIGIWILCFENLILQFRHKIYHNAVNRNALSTEIVICDEKEMSWIEEIN